MKMSVKDEPREMLPGLDFAWGQVNAVVTDRMVWQARHASDVLRLAVATASLDPAAMKAAALGIVLATVKIVECLVLEQQMRESIKGGTAGPP